MTNRIRYFLPFVGLLLALPATAKSLFVEAEAFSEHGGWKLDTQFIDEMGSPYLLAHGLGQPVKDAVTTVKFPQAGKYRVFVRTKDWVARWDAKGAPGKFELLVDGDSAGQFGDKGKIWGWQQGPEIEIKKAAVDALNTRSGVEKRFTGKLFVDCTGHGTIGHLAKADTEMEPKGRMGMSNMWRWENAGSAQEFPETPWALDLNMEDFPYPRDFHGQWFWESGFDKNPLGDAEGIRDWNLRAVYGAFSAIRAACMIPTWRNF